jgi:hypothetical protein
MAHHLKTKEAVFIDCHDASLETLNWDRTTQFLALELRDHAKEHRVLEMHGVEALMIQEFTASNIILENHILPAQEAPQLFWDCLFGKHVPVSDHFAERNRLLDKLDHTGFAITFIGSYGGSLWVLCRSAEWRIK